MYGPPLIEWVFITVGLVAAVAAWVFAVMGHPVPTFTLAGVALVSVTTAKVLQGRRHDRGHSR
jgi:hypothetical protein